MTTLAPGYGTSNDRRVINSVFTPTNFGPPVSGVASVFGTTRDWYGAIAVTFNPTVVAAATCLIELSADNVNFGAPLGQESVPANSLAGVVRVIPFYVPAGWALRFTVVNAVLGPLVLY